MYRCEAEDIGEIRVNSDWPGRDGILKTNTILQYKTDEFKEVESWGYKALYSKPSRKSRNDEARPIELFKLYLGNCLEKYRRKLPEPLTYRKAITDYLYEMGKVNN